MPKPPEYYVYYNKENGEWGAVKKDIFESYPDLIPNVSDPPGLLGPYESWTRIGAFKQAAADYGALEQMDEYQKMKLDSIKKVMAAAGDEL